MHEVFDRTLHALYEMLNGVTTQRIKFHKFLLPHTDECVISSVTYMASIMSYNAYNALYVRRHVRRIMRYVRHHVRRIMRYMSGAM